MPTDVSGHTLRNHVELRVQNHFPLISKLGVLGDKYIIFLSFLVHIHVFINIPTSIYDIINHKIFQAYLNFINLDYNIKLLLLN